MAKIIGLTFESETVGFICLHCGKEYKTEKGLLEHMAKEHPQE